MVVVVPGRAGICARFTEIEAILVLAPLEDLTHPKMRGSVQDKEEGLFVYAD